MVENIKYIMLNNDWCTCYNSLNHKTAYSQRQLIGFDIAHTKKTDTICLETKI